MAPSRRVLVVLAHPDDPDFYCGATVARWAAEGCEVIYCLLTRGEKGADDPKTDPVELARTREEEQRRAARHLGVSRVIFLDHPDGYLVPDLALRKDVVRVLRQVRPDTVVTCDPTNYYPSSTYINHPDHRAAGQAALDAIFPASGAGPFFPELITEEGLLPHEIQQVYIAGSQNPNVVIDVTATVDRKIEALRMHVSQIRDPEGMAARVRERMRDPSSPPDTPRYIERFMRVDLSG
ncbi:MAG TPA: PIG-L deacetylase family protein [Anaerolineales bacterium]|nr:PIG-L deacetylase family protein [Anaerolineales bacterium]